jgi:CubicO group peptidase (beta-lactamase class C family)
MQSLSSAKRRVAGALLLVTAAACSVVAPSRDTAPRERAAVHQQAYQLMLASRYDEALKLLSDVWASGPGDYDTAYNAACAAARLGDIDQAFVWLNRAAVTGQTDLAWMAQDPDLEPVRADARYPALVARATTTQEQRLAGQNVGGGLERSTPAAEGINEEALRALLERAEATQSSALVVLRNGKLVGEWYWGGPSFATESMSPTKAITSLAIGLLVDDGKIRSIDERVPAFFPEWRDGVHDAITIRQLLNHTSGLHADRTNEEVYASSDFVRYALGSGLDAAPGTEFYYNNSAANLVAGIAGVAAGKPMDAYLRERLFAPLGIRDVRWTRDPAGNPHGMAGLQIHAADFAKIGQLLLQDGMWTGKRLVSSQWIAESTSRPGSALNPVSGLLWWLETPESHVIIDQALLDTLRARGADPTFIEKLEPLRDKQIPSENQWDELRAVLGPKGSGQWFNEASKRRVEARIVVTAAYDGFSARGAFGQRLLVMPSRNLVVVRFTRQFDGKSRDVPFPDFTKLVRALVAPQ